MSTHDHDQLTAIQAVVDRISSYQDGATEGTVEKELREGFKEAGLDMSDDELTRLAQAIESEHGSVQAADVLS